MTDRARRINAAIKESKKFFDHECIFCGQGSVEGCHIFRRHVLKLVDCKYNIIPACRKHHIMLDNYEIFKTKPWQRVYTIKKYSMRDYKTKVEYWLEMLKQEVRK